MFCECGVVVFVVSVVVVGVGIFRFRFRSRSRSANWIQYFYSYSLVSCKILPCDIFLSVFVWFISILISFSQIRIPKRPNRGEMTEGINYLVVDR